MEPTLLTVLWLGLLLGMPFIMPAGRFARTHRAIRLSTDVVSMSYGVWLVIYRGMSLLHVR